jgi:hypothetical protein
MAWFVLLTAAAAVLAVGLAATAILFTRLGGWPEPPGRGFWGGLLAACGLTVGSVGLRSLRWIFLLRRAETRIPIRDAYIGYFSGLSLLFAPLLAGEIAVRAYVLRARGGVPVQTTIVVNVWERLLDLAALALIALAAGLGVGEVSAWTWMLAAGAVLALVPALRRVVLRAVAGAAEPVARMIDDDARSVSYRRLAGSRTWVVALLASAVPPLPHWASSRRSTPTPHRPP